MVEEIRSKWIVYYKKWELAITEDKRVVDISTKTTLVRVWNNGTISWRIPKTNKKIGEHTINKYAVKREVIIQNHIPF